MIERFLAKLQRKKRAYQAVYLDGHGSPNPMAAIVLSDLKRFCGINRGGIVVSPISRTVDPYATAYRAGQRDVYLRIVKMIDLDETAIEDDNA